MNYRMINIQRYDPDCAVDWDMESYEAWMHKYPSGEYIKYKDLADILEEARTWTDRELENNLLRLRYGK